MQQEGVGRSVLVGVAVLVVASLFGLFGLAAIFGGLPDPLSGLIWLALAVGCCWCALIPARSLTRAVASQLSRISGSSHSGSGHDWSERATRELAGLLVAVVCIVLVQAILRRPLVAVFGVGAEAFVVEAVVGIVALLTLLLVLSWAYAIARPLVEGLARTALDTAFVTSAPTSRLPELPETPTIVAPWPRVDAATEVARPPAVADTPTVIAPLPYGEPALTELVDPDATHIKR